MFQAFGIAGSLGQGGFAQSLTSGPQSHPLFGNRNRLRMGSLLKNLFSKLGAASQGGGCHQGGCGCGCSKASGQGGAFFAVIALLNSQPQEPERGAR